MNLIGNTQQICVSVYLFIYFSLLKRVSGQIGIEDENLCIAFLSPYLLGWKS